MYLCTQFGNHDIPALSVNLLIGRYAPLRKQWNVRRVANPSFINAFWAVIHVKTSVQQRMSEWPIIHRFLLPKTQYDFMFYIHDIMAVFYESLKKNVHWLFFTDNLKTYMRSFACMSVCLCRNIILDLHAPQRCYASYISLK